MRILLYILAACLLALEPFTLALTHILGHDALVTNFMWLSLLAIINYQLSIINYQGGSENEAARSQFTIHNSQFIINYSIPPIPLCRSSHAPPHLRPIGRDGRYSQ